VKKRWEHKEKQEHLQQEKQKTAAAKVVEIQKANVMPALFCSG
jgi:hypothetical protein